MASAFAGTRRGLPTTALVAGSMPTTVPEAPSTQTLPPATVMLAAPGTAMTAANRLRSKTGNVDSVGVDGGWVDGGLLALWGAPEHPAAASSTATASIRQRGGQEEGGRRVAGLAMAHLPSRTPERAPFLPHRSRAGSLEPGATGSAAGNWSGNSCGVEAGSHPGVACASPWSPAATLGFGPDSRFHSPTPRLENVQAEYGWLPAGRV
jgi:hypothetical protein